MFSKKFDRRVYATLSVFLLAGILGVSFGTYVLWPSNLEAGYQPEQPIPFNHALHAGTLRIDCLYCHFRAEKSAHATVPPVSLCMNCHGEVRPKDSQGNVKPAMLELVEHWENSEPIVWSKVTDLADFVYFDHSRHLAGGVTCQECHGLVESMEHLRREYGMKMSWCLDCHKQAPPEGSTARQRGWSTRAPIHCTTCHR